MNTTTFLCAFALLSAACGGGEPTGSRFELRVAPLDLAGVFDVEYTLSVWNGHTPRQLVWTQSQIRSTRYGNGLGDITYIGTCDADEPASMVELTLDHLFTKNASGVLTEIPADSWQNPSKPVSLKLYPTCKENQDVLVTFNVVVLRDAEQGFFDIAVNFSDVFCSAKVGCNEELLFNAEGKRDLTFIVGFACTSGVGDPTWLYLDDFALECTKLTDGVTTTTALSFNPDQEPGQHGPIGSGIFQHAVYQGDEDFDGLDKCYWNNAIGVKRTYLEGFDTCSIVGRGTAGTGPWDDNRSPAYTTYPRIDFAAEVWNTANASNTPPTPMLECFDHPLNGTPTGVTTGYTDGAVALGQRFSHRHGCGERRIACDVPLGRRADTEAAVTVSGLPGAGSVAITMANGTKVAAGTFDLPAGVTLRELNGCCTDECCAAP